MVTASFLDRAVGVFSPEAMERRVRARARIEGLDRARMIYDGATRSQRDAWRPVGATSANWEVMWSGSRLRDVARDFGRNNPYAVNVHNAIAGAVVGAGIIPSIDAGDRPKKKLQSLVASHLDTTDIDFDGRLNLYGLQSLAMRTIVEAGEVLIVRYAPAGASQRLSVPLQIRVLDPDYLYAYKNGPDAASNGNVIFQGIEFDKDGRRVAYWLYDEHPGGGVTWRMPNFKRVPASDVIHIYRVDRPGQMRGVPWSAPCIVTMRDLASYEEAELLRQKIAACFAVFYTGAPATSVAQSAEQAEIDKGRAPRETVEPGMIERLPTGADVKFAQPAMMQGYKDFVQVNARKVAVGYGVPYEVATGDLSNVSFISGRLGRIPFNISVDQWRWHMLIPHMCAGVGRWFLEASSIVLGGKAAATMTWTPPRREMVSPKDEIPAMKEAVRSGFTPRSEAVRSLGFDPEQVEQEYADENDRADKLNLRFDSDGRFPLNTRGNEIVPPDPGTGEQPAANPSNEGQNGQVPAN